MSEKICRVRRLVMTRIGETREDMLNIQKDIMNGRCRLLKGKIYNPTASNMNRFLMESAKINKLNESILKSLR